MQELPTVIPDVQMLLALSPQELAAKMLFLLKKRREETFNLGYLHNELWQQRSPYAPNQPPQYPRQYEHAVNIAIAEAWAWLHSQGLVIPEPGGNGQNGWRRLTRKARSIEGEAEFASFKIGRLLPRELLHPKLADPVCRHLCAANLTWQSFKP
jgi:hypothetical protein